MPHGDDVALLCLRDSRTLANGTQGQNAHLRLVDDGAHHVAKGPHVAHGVGAAGDVVRGQFARARAARSLT